MPQAASPRRWLRPAARAPHSLRVEVEVETLEQLREALAAGADIIMLDNMSVEDMREAVRIVDGRALTEASGNMGDKSDAELRAVAETGVDLISIGALTHSVRALDISSEVRPRVKSGIGDQAAPTAGGRARPPPAVA